MSILHNTSIVNTRGHARVTGACAMVDGYTIQSCIQSMSKLWLILLTMILITGVIGTANASIIGETVISSYTEWKDGNITAIGNISIIDGGTLVVDNTALKFNNSYICEYSMELSGNGKLIVKNNSVVGAVNTSNGATIMLFDDAIIKTNDSTFVGLEGNPVYSSTARCGGIVLYLSGSRSYFNNITFEDCENAVKSYYTYLTIENCNFSRIGNKYYSTGILPYGSEFYINNSSFYDSHLPIVTRTLSKATVTNNYFYNCSTPGSYTIDMLYYNKNVYIANNEIVNALKPIVLNGIMENITVENNYVHDCPRGSVVALNYDLENVTIRNNRGIDVYEGFVSGATGDSGANNTNIKIYNNTVINMTNCNTPSPKAAISIPLHNSTIYNCYFHARSTTTVGLWTKLAHQNSFQDHCKNVTYTNLTFDNFGYGARLSYGEDLTLIDVKFENSVYYDIQFLGNNSNIKFINTKFLPSSIYFSDVADVFMPYWYCDVKVVDENGTPISGANVSIVNNADHSYIPINRNGDEKSSFVTGNDGHTPLPIGNDSETMVLGDYSQKKDSKRDYKYSITAEKDGVSATVTDIDPDMTWYRLDPNVPTKNITIILSTAVETGYISGKVTDISATGIANATITVGTGFATTNATGGYTIPNLPAGIYTVTASANGYENTSWENIAVSANNTTIVNFQLMDGFDTNTLHLPTNITAASHGNSVTVPIILHDATGVACTGVKLTYDASVVAVTGATQGDFTTFFGFDDEHAADGWVTINTYISGTQLTGDVKVADVTLVAVGEAGDTSPLDMEILSMADQNGYSVSGTVSNGSFTVVVDNSPPVVTDPSASQLIPDDTDGVPSWGETATLSVIVTDESDISSVTIDLSAIGGSPVQQMTHIGGNVWSVTTSASAGTPPQTYELQVCATDIHGYTNMSESVELVVMRNGDVTGDGDVRSDDVTLLESYVTYSGQHTVSSEFVADVTGDGVVNIADAMLLANHVIYPDRYTLR